MKVAAFNKKTGNLIGRFETQCPQTLAILIADALGCSVVVKKVYEEFYQDPYNQTEEEERAELYMDEHLN